MKRIIVGLFVICFFNNAFSQYQAKLGDFEYQTDIFGKTSGIFIEGKQSIDTYLTGRADVIFMFQDDSDLIGHGTNGDLTFYEITEVSKTESYYCLKATYLKDKQATFYFDISVGGRDIVISHDKDQLLILLDSDIYTSAKYRSWIEVFKYLESKY